MRHKLKSIKLNRTSAHRRAMLANLTNALVMHEQISTTLPKAKALRPVVEKLITKAKNGSLASRRSIIAYTRDKSIAEKLISILAKRYESRSGGYTRIVKAGFRYGDMAPIAYIEFVDRDVSAKGQSHTEVTGQIEKIVN